MKRNILLLFVIAVVLTGCKNTETVAPPPTEEALSKADAFMNRKLDSNSNNSMKYAIPETLHESYEPNQMASTVFIAHNYRSRINEGIEQYESILSEIEVKEELSNQDKADLQFVSYINLENFIFKKDSGNAEMAATNLKRLMKHTKPIELRVLGRALMLAEEELSEEEYNGIRKYIVELHNSKFRDYDFLSSETIERLREESNRTMQLIGQVD